MEGNDDATAIRVTIDAMASSASDPLETVCLERLDETLCRDGPEFGTHAVTTLTAGASIAVSAGGIVSPTATRSAT